MSTLCDPMDCIQSMEFSRPEYRSGVPFPSPGDLPNPRTKPRSPSLQADSLPVEPPGKPKNTGVGSLFLFQGIFPIQELNRGLLHCRWILYQLSYLGSPQAHNGHFLVMKGMNCQYNINMDLKIIILSQRTRPNKRLHSVWLFHLHKIPENIN